MATRRSFLQAAIPLSVSPALGWAPEAAFPAAQPERALFPCPADGTEVGVNPPGFAWWPAKGAASHRLVIRDAAGKTVYAADKLKDPVHLPPRILPTGAYTWDVEACDGAGTVVARRGAWRFRVPAGVPELPWEDPRRLLARMPDSHPRYIFTAAELPRIRETLRTTRRAAWESIRQSAERALSVPMPEAPRYHTFEGQARQRMGYTVFFREFRHRVDGPLSVLGVAYLLSGEEKYGLRAKKILLEIGSWGLDGPMSVLSRYGDEPGLSMARHGHRVYDWVYPLFDASERERARQITAERAREVLRRLRRSNYLTSPSESHNGRLIAYLTEYAVVMKDEVPDAAEWLEYSLGALTTFYPHWGDSDGGWAEGVSYALAYNSIYLGAIESLRAATGFDLYRRPFFRNVRKFFLYCTSPVGEIKPFGDGAEGGGPQGGATLLVHHARRFQDPVSMWWAEQTGNARAADPMLSLVTEDNVKAEPPKGMPSAAVFRGIGWAGLHSALDDPRRDTFMVFKSSPFGSVSHSHADQNGFAILKGGRALAIPSGYYGPSYGFPHHADWTRQTKANNCILVNGQGQAVRDAAAQGRIETFRHQQAITYLCGDAAPAYKGKLTRCKRHVLFLRPGVFVLLDELAAPEAAEFSWLLHAFDKMTVDESAASVVVRRKGASLEARLVCEAGLAFRQTDQFDTPFNEGNPPEYHENRDNQWHFTATTRRKAAETRIAAVLLVRDEADTFQAAVKESAGVVTVAVSSPQGKGEVRARLRSGAGPLIEARWNTERFRL